MVYDGECRFCCRWVARWRRATGGFVDYLPFQDESIPARFPEIPRARFEEAVRLILPDGSVSHGAEAVFRSLAAAGRERWMLALYARFHTLADLAELAYEEVAEHRSFLSRMDRIYSGPGAAPPEYTRVRWLFLRGLALIYLIAFVSLWGQIHGLIGAHGIMPVQFTMKAAKAVDTEQHLGWKKFWQLPTLAWWADSDRALDWQCGIGTAGAVLLLFGLAPAPVLFLLWCVYLSLSSVCDPFLNFQWDYLLLETGFLAIFFAPLQWVERPQRQARPSFLVLWLLRWLIFRLMLESGCVKLLSGDPSWWRLTALQVHYQTQPLPTWIGWYAHQWPASFQAFCVFVMFVIELAGPCLIFAGRRARITAAASFIFFQVIIQLTGNYTYFNWLTILLCIPLLDDGALRWLSRKTQTVSGSMPPVRGGRWPRLLTAPLALLIFLVTFAELLQTLRVPEQWTNSIIPLEAGLEPLRSFNSYGLFRVMTQIRPEIIVEGSNDGKKWLAYEFKYKPGDLKQRPRFVAPFQPRLDWQMWFAALESPRQNQWFLNFEVRLLQNSPEVLALLKSNPFPGRPPKYIRAQLYEYQFTNPAERRATGDWWRRKYLGEYVPAISLPENRESGPPAKSSAANKNLPDGQVREKFHMVGWLKPVQRFL